MYRVRDTAPGLIVIWEKENCCGKNKAARQTLCKKTLDKCESTYKKPTIQWKCLAIFSNAISGESEVL
jgi:hypothetical protein